MKEGKKKEEEEEVQPGRFNKVKRDQENQKSGHGERSKVM